MSTRLWDVRDALTTQFADALAAAAISAHVFSSPRARTSKQRMYVLVGSDGGETGSDALEDGLTATQSASDLGPGGWRDEEGEVVCSAWAWSGNKTALEPETAARALFDACSGSLDEDRSLGGLLHNPGLAEVASLAVRDWQTPAGPVVRIVFSVSYGALITA